LVIFNHIVAGNTTLCGYILLPQNNLYYTDKLS